MTCVATANRIPWKPPPDTDARQPGKLQALGRRRHGDA